jgi:hypothetical protein
VIHADEIKSEFALLEPLCSKCGEYTVFSVNEKNDMFYNCTCPCKNTVLNPAEFIVYEDLDAYGKSVFIAGLVNIQFSTAMNKFGGTVRIVDKKLTIVNVNLYLVDAPREKEEFIIWLRNRKMLVDV